MEIGKLVLQIMMMVLLIFKKAQEREESNGFGSGSIGTSSAEHYPPSATYTPAEAKGQLGIQRHTNNKTRITKKNGSNVAKGYWKPKLQNKIKHCQLEVSEGRLRFSALPITKT